MGKQKIKKGPTRKMPKRRHVEAHVLEEPQYRPRVVREVRKDSYRDRRLDDEFDQ